MKVSESCRMVLMVLEEYQYATMGAYSPTMSELTLKGELKTRYRRVTMLTLIS
jgi:hypothetical protein